MTRRPKDNTVDGAVKAITQELEENASADAVFEALRELYSRETLKAIVAMTLTQPIPRYEADAMITQILTTATNLLTGIALSYSYCERMSQVAALTVKTTFFQPDRLLVNELECKVFESAWAADPEILTQTPERVLLEGGERTLYLFSDEQASDFTHRTAQSLQLVGRSYAQ